MPRKTDAQALKWVRDVCLKLPDASEGFHYGELVFKAQGRLFASCGAKRGPRMIVFRIDAKKTAVLLEQDDRFRRYAFEKSALQVAAGDVEDWEAMRGYLEESYRLSVAEAKKKTKRKPSKA
jgi:predicted DNA-binding protein (MmcQ/YjbR family)